MKTWHNLLYLATYDVIFVVLVSWLPEWHAPDGSMVETDSPLHITRRKRQSFEWSNWWKSAEKRT